MQFQLLTPQIGAVVDGFDVRTAPDVRSRDALRSALARHHVLCFRNQSPDVGHMLGFASVFGALARPTKLDVEHLHDQIAIFENDGSRPVIGSRWHADNTDWDAPPLAGILYCETVPAVGGDTVWTNLEAAYDALSPSLRSYLDGLTALHDNSQVVERYGVAGINAVSREPRPAVEHPVVRINPESGRRGLFVNAVYTRSIKGLAADESQALLAMLYSHANRPEFQVRLRWENRTLVIWENRTTLHYAVADYRGRRRMWRMAVAGDKPRGVGDAAVQAGTR